MKRLFGIGVVVLLAALVAAAPAFAIPKLMSYQGRLNDKNSNPVNETVPMTFTIWSDETSTGAEKKLWQETQSVVVMGGVFSVKLGEFTPLPESIFDTDVAYLGIKVKDDDEMTPRQQITSAAYSFKSINSESYDRILNYLGLSNLRNLQLGTSDLGAGQTDGWGEIYIDANGKTNRVNGADTSATFLLDRYKAITSSTDPYIYLSAQNIGTGNFAVNGCTCARTMADECLLTCKANNEAIERALIYKTLFYGSNGTDPRVFPSYVGSQITAMRTNVARDVGKRGYLITATSSSPQVSGTSSNQTIDLVFSEVQNNMFCSSWSNCSFGTGHSGYLKYASWEIPKGNLRNFPPAYYAAGASEIGFETTQDETNNPTTAFIKTDTASTNSNYGNGATVEVLLLASGQVTATRTSDNKSGAGSNSFSFIDYYSQYNVPPFSYSSEMPVSLISHAIPAGVFPSGISQAIGIPMIADWESGDDIQYRLSNTTEDTGWLPAGNNPQKTIFTAFTSQPTTLTVRLLPKPSNPVPGYPSIKGFWVYAE